MALYNKKTLVMLSTIFISLFIYFLAAFNERLLTLHKHWTTADDLDMGYPLLALTIYFIYKNIRNTTNATNLFILPIVALLSALLFISDLLDIKTLFFICFMLTFPACIATVLGLKTTHKLLVPLAIIAMAMPFWYILVPYLQTLTVIVVSYLSGLASLTVLIEGNYFTIASGTVHVAGGCSGLKYFMTAISLALISSAVNNRSIKLSLFSALCALSLALVANWIRVFILLVAAYMGGVDQPIMKDHDLLGWIVFAALMTPWFFIDNLINKKAPTNTANVEAEAEIKPPITQSSPLKLAISLTRCLILLSTPMVFLHYAENENHTIKLVELPNKLAGHPQTNHIPSGKIDYPKPANQARAQYLVNQDKLDVIVLTYDNTDKSVELANSTNHIFDEQNWREVEDIHWQSKENPNIKVLITLAKRGNHHKVAYSWYKHGKIFANTLLSSKLNQLLSQLKGIQSSELIVILKDCTVNCKNNLIPDKTLLEFILTTHQSIST
jgi:exosortase